MAEQHAVLTDPRRHGFQYGMQKHFEDEIARLTGAELVGLPRWAGPSFVRRRIAQGTRLAPLRKLVPRTQRTGVSADVVWVVLMGPEDTDLDLLAKWDRSTGYRILYLFDTFPHQLPAIRRLVSRVRWDLTVTSFHCAVPLLERETGRPWHAVAQGVIPAHFWPSSSAERQIAFSSYGRRLAGQHECLNEWTLARGMHYDTTIAASLQRDIDPRYLYRQYAWHLRHSQFTVCWPVELTHPERSAGLSAVTCRWFEAAASGVPMVGRAPQDPIFAELFGNDAVLPLDPSTGSRHAMIEQLDALWEQREAHVHGALARRSERLESWTWERRVLELMALARLAAPSTAKA